MALLKKIVKLPLLAPFLAILTPIMFIYAQNMGQLHYTDPARIVLLCLLFILPLVIIITGLTKNLSKGALIIALIIITSFIFGNLGRVIPYFEIYGIGNYRISRNPMLLLLTTSITLKGILYIVKTRRSVIIFITYLNLSCLIILGYNTLKLIRYYLYPVGNTYIPLTHRALSAANLTKLPDVYYIILDGHAREDILDLTFDHTLSPLYSYLREKGFYIADKSKANHVYTHLSLATSLNYDHIENLPIQFIKGQKNANLLTALIKNSKAARRFKQLGYTYVLANTGFYATENSPITDVYYEYKWGLNEFEQAVVRSNMYYVLFKFLEIDLATLHRERILFAFEALKTISKDPRPTFTFTHILSPHPPFIFSPDGSPAGKGRRFSYADGSGGFYTKEEYKSGYVNQLLFIDAKMIETIDEILANSNPQPIIIIQSDHGPASEVDWDKDNPNKFLSEVINDLSETSIKERTSILNAYYFPYGGNTLLYPEITPVNTFRVLFNYYFGGDFPLLEDKTRTDI